MRVLHQFDELRDIRGPLVLAAGYFDGVHRGHQAVIKAARAAAVPAHAGTWVLTLDPHPLKVLRPETAPRLLTSTPHKLRLLEALGVDGCLILPFTPALAALTPMEFVDRLCAAAPSLARMVVGPNWTFGRGARGTPDTLQELAHVRGFAVTVAEPTRSDGHPISSSRIREALQSGRLDQAAGWLGRPFSVLGTVVRGRQLGRQLGFPTANVDAESEVRPPAGIYAVQVKAADWTAGGAAYLGPSSPGVVEVHVLDRQDDLYGQELDVAFLHHLRAHQSFTRLTDLRDQIALDVQQARSLLARLRT
jgi:riboflavin kinase/FMN adenylyltransferase